MKIFTLIICLLCTFLATAQKDRLNAFYSTIDNHYKITDSTNQAKVFQYLNIAKNQKDANKVVRLTELLANYLLYLKNDHLKSYQLLQQNETFITNATNDEQIGKYYIVYADAAIYNQNHELSLNIAKKGIEILEKHQDSSIYEFGYSYLKAAETSMNLNKFTESATYYKKASQLFEYQKDTLFILWSKNGLGTLFSNNGLLEEAEKVRAPIYPLAKKINQEQVAAMAHISSALNASRNNESEKELYHTRAALKCNYKHSDIYEIVNTLSITFATAAYARNHKKDSSNYYLNALESKIKKHHDNAFIYAFYVLAKGYNAYANNHINKAEKYTLEYLKLIQHNKADPNYLKATQLIATIYDQKKQPEKALYYYKKYKHISDSLNREQSKTKFAYTQSLYEAEKKDLTISNQEKEIEVLDLENQQKKQTIFYSILGFIATLLVTYLILTKIRIRKAQKAQKAFSQSLILTQENERARLARELHDGIGQQLILLKKKVQPTSNTLGHMAETVLEDMRHITQNLHPAILKQLGLTETINQMIDAIDENTELFFTKDINSIDGILTPENEVNLYRIIQENINNIVKHAKATAVEVDVTQTSSNILVKIIDNGVGFNVVEKFKHSKSLGLQILKERTNILNGVLNIVSNINGTIIDITIPKQH